MPPVAALPERTWEAALPHPFRRPQLDALRPAFALTPAGPVVSTDAWSDRHLALLADGRWSRLTTEPGWHCRPRWAGDRLLADVFEDLAAERASSREIPGVDGVDEPPPGGGDLRLPPGARVEAAAPWRRGRIALLLRRGSARRVVCVGRDDVAHWDGPVVGMGPWLSDDEVVLVVESWPGRVACAWNVVSGARRPLVTPSTVVVDDVLGRAGLIGLSWTSAGEPRRLHLAAAAELARPVRLPGGGARYPVVDGPRSPLPCLVRDPAGVPRGTVLLLHGGPNGANLATWSPFAESLALAGWRVVQPNVRGSALVDPALRPPAPERYGADDVEDALCVLRRLAVGPIVAGGWSYGGYLASRVATRCPVSGVFLIGGFLRWSDLRPSGHPQVRAFLDRTGDRFAPDAGLAAVPHFVAHGERDPRIPVEAVRAHDLPPGSEWVGIAGEGHGTLTDHAARQVFPRLFHWLDGIPG